MGALGLVPLLIRGQVTGGDPFPRTAHSGKGGCPAQALGHCGVQPCQWASLTVRFSAHKPVEGVATAKATRPGHPPSAQAWETRSAGFNSEEMVLLSNRNKNSGLVVFL